ncbi:MAG: hypothetical protein WC868_11505 [Bacteroidales bacterium]
MKTKNVIKLAAILIAVIGISTAGCKKDKNEGSDKEIPSSLKKLANDEATIQSASDDVLNDVNDILAKKTNKGIDSLNWPCNVILDSTITAGSNVTYYLTFNGSNCNGTRNRDGKVEITIPINTHWSDVGATVTVKLINLKISKIPDNGKYVILNGTKTFENVSGGLVKDLGNGTITSVVHKITGAIQATFEDNTTRTWNITRQRTFTGTFPGQLIVTTDGFGSADGYSNLVVWGVNRDGENFYTQITQSVVHRQTCGWDPVSGIKIFQIPGDSKKATVTFGYDDFNNLVTGTNCPTRYKVDWEKNGNSGTMFIQLP